ncbi:MAG: helix-turn-helix transcriptional regulator [Acidobacteriota bacterium]
MRRHATLLARVLDQLKLPVFVFDGGRQIYANDAATDLAERLRVQDRIELRVLLLDHVGHVATVDNARGRTAPAASVTLLTSHSGEPFYLHVLPLTRGRSRQTSSYAVTVRSSGADVVAFRQRYRLTDREAQITALILRGNGNREIAQGLGITIATTKKHLGRIFDKVGVDSRAQLMAKLG